MFANFVQETCTGTGLTLTLAGITAGMIPFSASFADGDLVSYVVEDSGGTIKVAGAGTYNSAGNTVTRNDGWNYNGATVDKKPATNIALSAGTHTIRCDVVGARLDTGGIISGRIYTPPIYSETASHATFGDHRIFYCPVKIDYAGYYNSFAAEVVIASGAGNAIFGLYTSKDGLPDQLIALHAADVDTTTTGLKVATFDGGSVFLEKGHYYAAINNSDAPLWRASQPDSVLSSQLGSAVINSVSSYVFKGSAYVIPSPADISVLSFGGSRCPIVGVIAT